MKGRVSFRGILLLMLLAAAAGLLAEQQPASPAPRTPAPQTPTFRTGVNAVVVDARVMDAEGRFVRGLTRDDFVLFEDGKQQELSLFSFIDIPIEGPPEPVFAGSRVERDAVSNGLPDDGRLYVLVLDDAWGNASQLRWPVLQATAHEFIEHYMTDADRMALITTSGRKDVTQQFTNNRRRLLDAVDRYVPGYGQEITTAVAGQMPPRPDAWRPNALFSAGRAPDSGRTQMISLKGVADWLAGVPGRRKSIVVITERSDCGSELAASHGDPMRGSDTRELVHAAARSTVSVYAITPTGMPASSRDTGIDARSPLSSPLTARGNLVVVSPGPNRDVEWGRSDSCTQGLGAVTRDTGGFSLSAGFPGVLERIVAENSTYYLLGYTSSNGDRDGAFRTIEVRTKRQDLRVVSRTGYLAKDPKSRKPITLAGIPPALNEVFQSPLPIPGLTLSVTAPSFRVSGSKASVAIVVEARVGQLQFLERDARLSGAMRIVMVAADDDGKVKAREYGSLTMQLTPDVHGTITEHGARLLTKLELKPGRYQLRVAAIDVAGGGPRGSVLYDLDVPDFSKGPLAMSGIGLISAAASAAPTTGPDERWKRFVGAPPTTTRDFGRDDELRRYVEIYDNSKRKDHLVEVTTLVRAESGREVFSETQSVASAPVKGKPPTHRLLTTIPLSALVPGQYVLTVEARSNAILALPASREIPFSVH